MQKKLWITRKWVFFCSKSSIFYNRCIKNQPTYTKNWEPFFHDVSMDNRLELCEKKALNFLWVILTWSECRIFCSKYRIFLLQVQYFLYSLQKKKKKNQLTNCKNWEPFIGIFKIQEKRLANLCGWVFFSAPIENTIRIESSNKVI